MSVSAPQPAPAQRNPALEKAYAQAQAQQNDPNVLVIAASSESLKGIPNWDRIMKVVDCVNSRPETVDVVVQALHKRMESKDHTIALAALTCIEALVKNAPVARQYIGSETFLHALAHTLPKQVRKPASKSIFRFDHTRDVFAMEHYDRVLVLMQSWGRAFDPNTNPSEECKDLQFYNYYKKLLENGVKFAEPDLDELAPVLTPPPNPTVTPPPRKSVGTISSGGKTKKRPPLIYSSIPTFEDRECQELWCKLQLLCEIIDGISSNNVTQLKEDAAATTLFEGIQRDLKRVRERLTQQNNDSTLSQLLLLDDACPLAMKYYVEVCEGKMMTRPESRALSAQSSTQATNLPSDEKQPENGPINRNVATRSPGAPEPQRTISEAAQLQSYHNQYSRHSANSALFPTQALPHPMFMRGPQ